MQDNVTVLKLPDGLSALGPDLGWYTSSGPQSLRNQERGVPATVGRQGGRTDRNESGYRGTTPRGASGPIILS